MILVLLLVFRELSSAPALFGIVVLASCVGESSELLTVHILGVYRTSPSPLVSHETYQASTSSFCSGFIPQSSSPKSKPNMRQAFALVLAAIGGVLGAPATSSLGGETSINPKRDTTSRVWAGAVQEGQAGTGWNFVQGSIVVPNISGQSSDARPPSGWALTETTVVPRSSRRV